MYYKFYKHEGKIVPYNNKNRNKNSIVESHNKE